MKDIVSEYWYVILTIAIGAFLRLFRLPEYMMFLGDQGRDATIIKRILTFEHFPLIGAPSSVGGVYLGPFYYYFISPFLAIFNFNPVGLAYGVAFISTIGLVLSYLLVKKLSSSKTAFIFLFLLAFSSANISLSRFSWNPNLLPFFSFLTLYFFYLFLAHRSKLNSLIFGTLFALSLQLHYLALALLIPFIYFIYEILFCSKKKKVVSELMPAVLSFVFISLPLILFDLKHNFLNTRNFLAFFSSPSDRSPGLSYLYKLGTTTQAFFGHVFQFSPPPALPFLGLILLVVLFFRIKRSPENLFVRIHLLSVISFILFFSILNNPRFEHYYAPVYYSFFLLMAIVLVRYRVIIIVTVLLLYAALQINHYNFFSQKNRSQLKIAKTIADDVAPYIKGRIFQTLPLPIGATDGHIRYFLELGGHKALPEDSTIQPDELFVFCFESPCLVLGNPQWQIAVFQNKKLDTIIKSDGVTIYKIVHEK